MVKWLLGLLAATWAWIVRSFFARRAEERMAQERDAALAAAKQQEIKATAKAKEVDLLNEQQKREDSIHATSGDDTLDRLNQLFKR